MNFSNCRLILTPVQVHLVVGFCYFADKITTMHSGRCSLLSVLALLQHKLLLRHYIII